MISRDLGATALLIVSWGLGSGQQIETGFLDRTVVVAGHSYRFQVFVPPRYNPGTVWPVILFLNGAGERGDDGAAQTTAGLGPAIRRDPSRFPAIVVFPQLPKDSQWVGMPAELALKALAQTEAEFRVDRDRVYLTGVSMGGHGAWYLAYRHPELFAAIAPICGWIGEIPKYPGSVPVVPPDSGWPVPAVTRRLGRLPIWILHGEMDPEVPIAGAREAAAALKENGGNVRFTEYLGLTHNVWDAAYASTEFVTWLFAQRRSKP